MQEHSQLASGHKTHARTLEPKLSMVGLESFVGSDIQIECFEAPAGRTSSAAPELEQSSSGSYGDTVPGSRGHKVYNFEVAEHHTYVADEVRVHNQSGTFVSIDGKLYFDSHSTVGFDAIDVALYNKLWHADKPNPLGTVKVPSTDGNGWDWVYAAKTPNGDPHPFAGEGWQPGGDFDEDGVLTPTDRALHDADLYERQAAIAQAGGNEGRAQDLNAKAQEIRNSEPIILDLDFDPSTGGTPDGIEISTNMVQFDIDDDGFIESTSWAAADDGFLVIDLEEDGSIGDRGGDGKIDQGRELVFTNWLPGGIGTDLEALAFAVNEDGNRIFDTDGNGVLNADDEEVWGSFKVWQDLDQDGITDPDELKSLSEWSITEINLRYDNDADYSSPEEAFADRTDDVTVFGNSLLGSASYTRDGTTYAGVVGDVSLRGTTLGYREVQTANGFDIEFETGETMRYGVVEGDDDIRVDLTALWLDGAYGDSRDNILTAADHSLAVILEGREGDDTLTGGLGNDTLSGHDGADALRGNDGNDLLFFDADDSVVFGGTGYDTAIARGDTGVNLDVAWGRIEMTIGTIGGDNITAAGGYTMAQIVGGAGRDTLTGSLEGDILTGDADADILDGRESDDALFGGEGGDTLIGGAGDDLVEGGLGSDLIDAGTGDDVVFAGNGVDTLIGGDGDDFLYGDEGDDDLQGGAGDDALAGGWGHDTLTDTEGDNAFLAGRGDDTIVIGSGPTNSTVFGNAGFDTLHLTGAESDWHITYREAPIYETEHYTNSFGDSESRQVIAGYDGIAQYSVYSTAASGNDILLEIVDIEKLLFENGGAPTELLLAETDASADNTQTFREIIFEDLSAYYSSVDDIWASFHYETDGYLQNAANIPTIGNDTFNGFSGDDTILGNNGDDTLIGGAGADAIDGEQGNDSIEGNSGADGLFGGDGNDTISGGSGADALNGQAGYDDLFAGSGSDLAVGGDGGDEIYGDTGDDTLIGDHAEDSLTGSGTHEDILWGEDGNDLLYGGKGYDRLLGGRDQDELFGGDGGDHLNGGTGFDYLEGEAGQDTLLGGHGSDTLFGGEHADTLEGGQDNDFLDGGTSADSLDGGQGNDYLIGGLGADTLNGGDGVDAVSYEGSGAGVVLNLSQDTIDPSQPTNPGDVGASSGHAEGDVFISIESFRGSSHSDTMQGDDFHNVLDGFDGDDRLLGRGGNDILVGDIGNDTLSGSDGNDLLLGGDGDDRLLGGADDDILRGGDGLDELLAGAGDDTVYMDDVDLARDYGGNEASIGSSGYDWLILEEGSVFAPTDKTLSDFGFEAFEGAEYDDRAIGDNDTVDYHLIGGLGDDTLQGAGGDDTLEGGGGADALRGGYGSDTVSYAKATGGVLVDLRDPADNANDDWFKRSEARQDTYSNIENIVGSRFNDNLRGDDHNNVISGEGGDDLLFGRGGSDTFVFGNSFGSDTVKDFGNGADKIDLSRNSNIDDWADLVANHLRVENNMVVIDDGFGNTITIEDISQISQLDAGDFVL